MTLILGCALIAIGIYIMVETLIQGYKDWVDIKEKVKDAKAVKDDRFR